MGLLANTPHGKKNLTCETKFDDGVSHLSKFIPCSIMKVYPLLGGGRGGGVERHDATVRLLVMVVVGLHMAQTDFY